MLSNKHRDALIANWGDNTESLCVYAPVRVYDAHGPWQCFLVAMNPDWQNEIFCIISSGCKSDAFIGAWSLDDMSAMYNSHGEPLEVDQEYSLKLASQIIREL